MGILLLLLKVVAVVVLGVIAIVVAFYLLCMGICLLVIIWPFHTILAVIALFTFDAGWLLFGWLGYLVNSLLAALPFIVLLLEDGFGSDEPVYHSSSTAPAERRTRSVVPSPFILVHIVTRRIHF
jgi:hypothetical protein